MKGRERINVQKSFRRIGECCPLGPSDYMGFLDSDIEAAITASLTDVNYPSAGPPGADRQASTRSLEEAGIPATPGRLRARPQEARRTAVVARGCHARANTFGPVNPLVATVLTRTEPTPRMSEPMPESACMCAGSARL